MGATLGGGRGAERDVLSAPRAGSTPPRRQTHQRAQRRRLPDTFQAPKPRQEPLGPAGRTGLSRSWRVARPAGRSRTSKVTAVLYPLRKRRGGARRGGTRAVSPSARQMRPCASSRAPGSQTPSLPIGGRSDTAAAAPRATQPLSWGARRGRAGGGGGRGAARGERRRRQLLLRRPWPPCPREAVGRRRPQAAERTAPLLAGSCARTRAGRGRLESGDRAGWRQSRHAGCGQHWRHPLVLNTPRAGGFVPSRLAMKTSFSVCSRLRSAWPGMARGKIWPGDSDCETFGARPSVSGLGGIPCAQEF